ncbi:MAG: TlpA disulfide reductase family protein [Pseudomonadota bacterium]
MRFLLLALSLSVAACDSAAPPAADTPAADTPAADTPAAASSVAGIKTGIWRVVLEHPGGGLPFSLEITQGPEAYFLNGPERMKAEEMTLQDGALDIRFPSYESSLKAQLQDDGTLVGSVTLTRRLGEVKKLAFPLVATHGQTWRHFPEQDPNPVDIAGTWAVKQSDPFGSAPPRDGLGIFEQDGAIVTGTVMFSQGDYRWLQGEVKDGELYLSTFDGGQGTVWRAAIQEDGSLKGLFHAKSYGFPPIAWSAKRDPDAKLPNPNSFTKLKDGVERIDFTFPDPDGAMVSLSDAKFQNQVVVISIGGTWCPTCHDEAAFLAPYYEANKDRGLEMIGLQFEYTDDPERSARQTKRFKQRYGITYDMLIAGVFGKEGVAKALPFLDGLTAYPTTLFLDRSGQVRRIHTSFPGAATGKRHELYVAEFKTFLNELLAEDG